MARVIEVAPCPICGARLRKKVTMRWRETVFDHPRNGCENEPLRVRGYMVKDWNARSVENGSTTDA